MNRLAHVNWNQVLLALLISAGIYTLLTPNEVQAQIFSTGINAICDDTYPRYQGVTKRVVHCIQDSIIWGTVQYFNDVYGYLKNTIYAFFTLVVVLFGVGVLTQSVENVGRDSFMLIVKLAVVIGLLENMGWLYTSIVDMTEGLLSLVVQFGMSGYGFIQCPFNSPIEYADVWFRVDCMLDSLIGIGGKGPGLEVGTGPAGLSRGLLHFFMSSAPGSALGLVLLAMGFYVIFTLGMSILRAAQTYILGFLGISFMMAVAPLFIPLLVMKETKTYFDKWAKIILAFILQPVILFAFINMCLIALDVVMVSGEESFMRSIAGHRVLDSNGDGFRDGNFNLNIFLEQEDLLTDKKAVISIPGVNLNEACLKMREGLDGNPLLDINEECPVGTEDGGYAFPFYMVNYAKLAEIRAGPSEPQPLAGINPSASPEEQGEQMRSIVTTNALIMLLTAFLFMSMLTYIPAMAHDLSGGAYETPNLYHSRNDGALGGGLPFENDLKGATQGMATEIRQGINNADGASIAGGLATAGGLGAAIYGAVDGLMAPDSAQVAASQAYTYGAAAQMLDGKQILVQTDPNDPASTVQISPADAYRALGAQDLRDIQRSNESVILLNPNEDGSRLEVSEMIRQDATPQFIGGTVAGAQAVVENAQARVDREEAAATLAQEQRDALEQNNNLLEESLQTLRSAGPDAYVAERLQQDALQEMQSSGAFGFGDASPEQIQAVVNEATNAQQLEQGLAGLGITSAADQYAAAQMGNTARGDANDVAVSSFMEQRENAFQQQYGESLQATAQTIDTPEVQNSLRAEYTGLLDTREAELVAAEALEAQRNETLAAEQRDLKAAEEELARLKEQDIVSAARELEEAQAASEQAAQQSAANEQARQQDAAASAVGVDVQSDEGQRLAQEQTETSDAQTIAATARAGLTSMQNSNGESVMGAAETTDATVAAEMETTTVAASTLEGDTLQSEVIGGAANDTLAREDSNDSAPQAKVSSDDDAAFAAFDEKVAAVEKEHTEKLDEELGALSERSGVAAGAPVAEAVAQDNMGDETPASPSATEDPVAPSLNEEAPDPAQEAKTITEDVPVAPPEQNPIREEEIAQTQRELTQEEATRIATAQASIEAQEAMRDVANERMADTQELMLAEQSKLEALRQAEAPDDAAIADTENRLGALEKERDAARAELTQAEDNIAEYSGNLETLIAVGDMQQQAQERKQEREAAAGDVQERDDQTLRELDRASLQDKTDLADEAKAQFTVVQNGLNELYNDRNAVQEEKDSIQSDMQQLAVLDATQDMQALQKILETDETDADRLAALRDGRVSELLSEAGDKQDEIDAYAAQVTLDEQVRDSMQAQLDQTQADAQSARDAYRAREDAIAGTGDVEAIANVEAEIDVLERRLQNIETQPLPQAVSIDPRVEQEMIVAAVADPEHLDPERLEALEDTMYAARSALREGESLDNLLDKDGLLGQLEDADKALVMQAMAVQTPGERERITAAIPEDAQRAFESEFSEALATVRIEVATGEEGASTAASAAYAQERAAIQAELDALQATLQAEHGINPRPRTIDGGRELIGYEEMVGYFKNVNLRDGEGNALGMKDYYNSLSNEDLAELHSASLNGVIPEYIAAINGVGGVDASILNAETFIRTQEIALPEDPFVPDERDEMPYDAFRQMVAKNGAPVDSEGAPMSAAEAYQMMNAAQLRQLKRLQEQMESEADIAQSEVENLDFSTAEGSTITGAQVREGIEEIQRQTDQIDDAEARALGVNPDEEDKE